MKIKDFLTVSEYETYTAIIQFLRLKNKDDFSVNELWNSVFMNFYTRGTIQHYFTRLRKKGVINIMNNRTDIGEYNYLINKKWI